MKKILLAVVLTSLVITSFAQSTSNASTPKAAVADSTAQPIFINAEQFAKQVIDYKAEDWRFVGDKPVVIDFFATWCPPCKKLDPVLKQLAREYADRVVFYKVDVDKEPELVKAFKVHSMPTMVYIPMNGELKRSIGYMPKDKLAGTIDKYIFGK